MNAKWVHRAVLLAVLGMTFPVASFAGFFNVGITASGFEYTFFNKFDGATTNFNGNGRNAHNNNTLFVYTWIAF